MVLAGAPQALRALEEAVPDEAVQCMIGRARPGTVRDRVRAWESYARWLQARHRVAWPETAEHVI
eukprot:10390492-Lingulodinium_polyedra.AAC.1